MGEPGLTNTLLAENEWAKGEIERLRGIINGLRCVTSAAPIARDCIEMKAQHRPEWKMCQVCKAKEAAK